MRGINPTLRGFAIILFVAAAITAVGAEAGLYWLLFVLRIAFIVAIADFAASFALPYPESGLEALVFFVVLGACAFAMWRVWRDEHTYGY